MINIKQFDNIKILGIRVDMVQISDVLVRMEQWIRDRGKGNYIVVANADSVVKSKKNKIFKDAVNNSSLSVPDGIPLVLFGRFYGYGLKRRVCGPELMDEFCRLAEKKGYTNYFYGAKEHTLNKLKCNFLQKFSGLKIVGMFAPPFRDLKEDENTQTINIINDTKPDVLWVGLGCPKQEIWMYKNHGKLNVPVIIGVGAAFDFYGGTKKQAPVWMREHGLEWFFRLIQEPKRLWKRYLIGNAIFIWLVLKELVKKGRNDREGKRVE